jgi:hypothetical protein
LDEPFLGKSLRPERWLLLNCEMGLDDSSQDNANDTRGRGTTTRRMSDQDVAASNNECSDVTAEERPNSLLSSSSSSPSLDAWRLLAFIASSAIMESQSNQVSPNAVGLSLSCKSKSDDPGLGSRQI